MQQFCNNSTASPSRQFGVPVHNRLGDMPAVLAQGLDAKLEHVPGVPRPDALQQLDDRRLQVYATVCRPIVVKPHDHAPTKPRSLDLQVRFRWDELS